MFLHCILFIYRSEIICFITISAYVVSISLLSLLLSLSPSHTNALVFTPPKYHISTKRSHVEVDWRNLLNNSVRFDIFSSDHFSYQKHKCTSAHKKDIQVPVCPLCSEPVPTPRGISPDMTVGQHIDQYCKSDKTKIFTNRCSFRGCKKKELIPVNCGLCKLNFCLRHRHSVDHDCNPKARSNLLA